MKRVRKPVHTDVAVIIVKQHTAAITTMTAVVHRDVTTVLKQRVQPRIRLAV